MDDGQDFTGDRGPARAAPRDSLFLLTTLTTLDGAPLGKARVRNLSATGLMADCEKPLAADTRVVMDLRGIGRVEGTVAWSRRDKIGVAFDQEVDPQLARKPVSGGGGQAMPDFLRTSTARRIG